MSLSWQAVLDSNGGGELPNGDGARVAKIALQHHCVLEFTGAETESFLQGQFCNDLAEVTQSRAQLSGYCSPKGRLLALFTLLATEDGYLMILPEALQEGICKRLQMFIMRADVTITRREDLLCTGVLVPAGADHSLPLPALPNVMDVDASGQGIWLRAGSTQYLFVADVSQQQALWGTDALHASTDLWQMRNIRSGQPSIHTETTEQFVPQMVNLQQANGLSFTKGCYPGQEIVARMQYLGKLKRQMFRFSYSGDTAPAIGSAITSDEDADAGVVVDAVAIGSEVELLAVMKLSAIESALSASGHPLTQQPLPYEL